MALNPRMVIGDIDVSWGGGVFHVVRGTIIDCPPGSLMETAYGGSGNLADLTGSAALAVSNGAGTVAGGSG